MLNNGSLFVASRRRSNLSNSFMSSEANSSVDDAVQQAEMTTASSYSTSSARQVLGRASIDARRRSPLNLTDNTRTTDVSQGGANATTASHRQIVEKNKPSLAASFFDTATLQQVSNGHVSCATPSTDSFVTTFDHRQSMQGERGREGDLHASHVRTQIDYMRARRPSTIKEHATPVKRSHLKSRFSVSPRHQKPLPSISAYREGRQQKKLLSPMTTVRRKAVPTGSPGSHAEVERPLPVPPTEQKHTQDPLAGRNENLEPILPHVSKGYATYNRQRWSKSTVQVSSHFVPARTSTDFLKAMEAEKRSTVVVRGSWIDVQKDPKQVSSLPNGGGWWKKLRSRRKSLFTKRSAKQQPELVQEEVPRPSYSVDRTASPVTKVVDHNVDCVVPLPSMKTSPESLSGPNPLPPAIQIDDDGLERSPRLPRHALRPLQLHTHNNEYAVVAGSNLVGQMSRKLQHSRVKSRNLSISLPYLVHNDMSDESEEEETMTDIPKLADAQNLTQKTVSSSILDLDETLEAKRCSTFLSAKVGSPIQFPTMTPNRATDALFDLVKHYKSDTSLNMLSPARVSSAWEMPCQEVQGSTEQLASHLSPTTQRLRRTTCTTMETIMTYQSSCDSSLVSSQAFRASWCSRSTGSLEAYPDPPINRSHDVEHSVRHSADHQVSDATSPTFCTTDGEDKSRAFVDSIVELYDNSGVRWCDEKVDKRDTLLEYESQCGPSPQRPPSRLAQHRRGAGVTVARMMLPDTSKALISTIREYSASHCFRVRALSPARSNNKKVYSPRCEVPLYCATDIPPKIRIDRPESDSTLSRTSMCPSDTTSTICKAEVQHARVARKSIASVLDYSDLAKAGALQLGQSRRSDLSTDVLSTAMPWPSRPRNSSTSSINSPGSQIMSELPSFAWSNNRTSSIGTSYTIPSPCLGLKSNERRRAPPSALLDLPFQRDRKMSMSIALETMQNSQDEYPDSEYTLGVMKLFQPPTTMKQARVFLKDSEEEYTSLMKKQREQQVEASLAIQELDERLFSPTRQQAGRGHWRKFCFEEISPNTKKRNIPFGCDRTFGVGGGGDQSGTVSLHGSDSKCDSSVVCSDGSSLLCPSSLSSLFSFPTESSPVRRGNHAGAEAMTMARSGLLSRMSSFNSDASTSSSLLSGSQVARFLPFTTSPSTHGSQRQQNDQMELIQDNRVCSSQPPSLRIVVQSPTTDGYNTPL